MKITKTLIRSIANSYTISELQCKIHEALEKLGTGGVITSAASGGGTSYTRQITGTPDELVELYQRALDYKQCLSADDGLTQSNPIVFCSHGKI